MWGFFCFVFCKISINLISGILLCDWILHIFIKTFSKISYYLLDSKGKKRVENWWAVTLQMERNKEKGVSFILFNTGLSRSHQCQLICLCQTMPKVYWRKECKEEWGGKCFIRSIANPKFTKCPDETGFSQTIMRNSCLTMLISYWEFLRFLPC